MVFTSPMPAAVLILVVGDLSSYGTVKGTTDRAVVSFVSGDVRKDL